MGIYGNDMGLEGSANRGKYIKNKKEPLKKGVGILDD